MRNAETLRSLAPRGVLLRGSLLMAIALAMPSQAEAAKLVGLGGKCVDVQAAGTANGTPVNLFECNGGANQSWEFEVAGPFFRVRGLAAKCLRPSAGAGSQLELGPCDGMTDRWQPGGTFSNGFTLVHVSTGECMDVENASTANGTPINLFPCHGQANQRWSFVQEPVVDPEPGSLVGLGGKCADVEGASSADGTPVNLFTCHGGDNQSWEFVSAPPFYRVQGLGGKCLVPGDPDAMGDPSAVLGPCGGLESRWQPSASFPTGFTLVHADTGRCLDVENASAVDGTPLNLHPCNGGLNQLWSYEEGMTGTGDCFDSPTQLCLNGERFKVEVDWEDFAGETGPGRTLPFGSDDSGLFWFFEATNWELLVKVLDGCGVNNHYWVFAAATTNVEYTLTITDTQTGDVNRYTNPLGVDSEAITDTGAFATCP